MRGAVAIALLATVAAGCGRWRHRARARPEVDPRAANATACVDPRYVASSRVALPVAAPATEVAVGGGRGRRYVVWVDAAGGHGWDFGARRVDVPAGPEACALAWRALDLRGRSPCGAARQEARGGGRRARLTVEERGGAPALFVATRGEAQQLSARFAAGDRGAIVWDGGAFGVVWSEPVGGAPPRAFVALVDREGRRLGSAMRVRVEDTVGLRDARIAFVGPDYLIAALRDDGGIELRETGPRVCDEPLLPQPPALP